MGEIIDTSLGMGKRYDTYIVKILLISILIDKLK